MGGWISTHWFDLIQCAGIISAHAFPVYYRRQDTKVRQLQNLAQLSEQHRSIWRDYERDPELWRIKQRVVNLEIEPVTPKEESFVRSLVNHTFRAYEAVRLQEVIGIGRLDSDAGNFFSLPIPSIVWEEIKSVQDPDFARFIEAARAVARKVHYS